MKVRMGLLWVFFCVLIIAGAVGLVCAADGEGPVPISRPQEAEGGRNPGGFTIEGAGAELVVNSDLGTDAGLVFMENGLSNWTIYCDVSAGDDLRFASGDNEALVIATDGAISHNYQGAGNALWASGETSLAMYLIRNEYAGTGYAISAGMNSSSASASSYGVYGYNYGSGYGLYGKAYANSGTGLYGTNTNTGTFGHIGSTSYGVYGNSGLNGNHGILGYGLTSGGFFSNSIGNSAYLSTSNNSVYGWLSSVNPGDYAIYGYGVHFGGDDGTSYQVSDTLGGIKGYNYYGNYYTFGTAGYSDLDYNRCGGTFGGYSAGSIWGCLCYKNSANNSYGGYFTSYTSGSGKVVGDVVAGIGLSASGNLLGGWLRGETYGQYVRGKRYGQYVHGDTYTNGVVASIQETGGERLTVYAPASETIDIYAYGVAMLDAGELHVRFSDTFTKLVADPDKVVVTVTPMGRSAGIYLSEVSDGGFVVVDESGENSPVRFSWIAIGPRKGFETHETPVELLAADFDDQMEQVTLSDVDTGITARGLYFDKELHFGTPPVQPAPKTVE
ncbi:hypothetical protein JW905_19200 [bacterium]|nr:hypothetical protein [candidate division CSSED10-310 bacterium]